MRHFYTLLLLAFACTAHAQSPTDGHMMPKGQLCVLGQYTNSSWDHYWEASRKRDNLNLGKVSTHSALLIANYGITRKLNVLLGLPYVWTSSDVSYITGQKNFQDAALFVKYQALEIPLGNGQFKIQATGGASTPVSNYTPDLMPFSIGLHTPTASLRAILHYISEPGFYVTAQAGHTWRGNTTIDHFGYLFDSQFIESDIMPVPNLFDYSARLGYIKPRLQAEIWYDAFTGLSGDDIRYNEAPQASNKMRASQIGVFGKYFILKRLGILASFSQVLNGRNVGQSQTWTVGATYFFNLNEPENTEK